MNTITLADFLQEDQGKRYKDVASDNQVDWGRWVEWLNTDERQARLEIAEIHFDLPALAGILKELESESFVENYFKKRKTQETKRVKQALGVLVMMHMVARGWQTTGKKGPLGRRDPNALNQGSHNTARSFSKFILSAERYLRPMGS